MDYGLGPVKQTKQRLNTQSGFSLMELMIVMAIIALTSAVIIPRIGNSDNKLYQAQVRTLLASLNYNRRNAVIRNQPHTMKLYPYTEGDKHQLKLKKGNWQSKGAIIQWQTDKQVVKNKPFTIRYFPQGGATGGTIDIQQGRFKAKIYIDGITGKSTLKETADET